ncbi:MAG: peptide deformylase, partial [Proteobacteria bacterium]|nr:peptide deformylase [Pseudomonadota bacterium]
SLMSNMAETMYAAPGVGLAAPQIGDSRRFVVVDPGEGDERGTRLSIMVNPQIIERSKETIVWRETCLSVPGMEVDVKRSFGILVRWQRPEDGLPQEESFEEYEAVIVQHELDHLDGHTIYERASRFKRGRWMKRQKKAALLR